VNLEELREDFLSMVREFQDHKATIEALIVEHRSTVNRTFVLLYQELEADRKSRISRQKKQDIKDYVLIGCGVLTLAIGCSIIGILAYLILSSRIVSV
jgi:hypothetical protein